MRFRVNHNPQHQRWEVKDNLCCNQVVGSHLNALNAEAQMEYEEALWHSFDSETQEVHIEHWCLFYSLDKNIGLNADIDSAVFASTK